MEKLVILHTCPARHLPRKGGDRYPSYIAMYRMQKGRPKPPSWENWVPPSKENDHPAVPVVMVVVVVVVLPPELLEVLVMVVMMMAVHAVGGRRADSAGERAGGDENGDEA